MGNTAAKCSDGAKGYQMIPPAPPMTAASTCIMEGLLGVYFVLCNTTLYMAQPRRLKSRWKSRRKTGYVILAITRIWERA